MTRTAKILIGTVGALTLVAGFVFLTPYGRVLASGAGPAGMRGWMGGNFTSQMAAMHGGQVNGQMAAMHNGVIAQFGGDMGAMHQSMSGLMTEMPAIHNQVVAALAEKLGLTPEALQAELARGTTLAALAEARQVSPDALRATMIGSMQQALTDLVQAGKLDANIAARMRELIPQHAGICLTTDMSGMQGAMGGMAGMMGW